MKTETETSDRRLVNGYRFSLEGKGHARRFKVEVHQR